MDETKTEERGVEQRPSGPKLRFVPLLILILCLTTLLIASLRIMGHGFQPSDDALRHVAKVMSGKGWSEILLIRPEITMDSHPGWHAVLGVFQSFTMADPDSLLVFSMLSLFLLFAFVPTFFFRRPEAWILALLIMVIFSLRPLYRSLYGRPFVFSMFVMVLFCFLWKPVRDQCNAYLALAGYALATALATWIHGTWYLLILPLVALFLAREWRVFFLMSGATGVGVFSGALLTGKPLTFLHQMVFHAVEAFGAHELQRQLVAEFQPFDGAPLVFMVVVGLLIWRFTRGGWAATCVDNPVFFLGVLGWILGFISARFWTDWGWPAMTVWVAFELEHVFEKELCQFSLKRLAIATMICLVFFVGLTNDRGGRWTNKLGVRWPKMVVSDHRPWLPNEGGILYSDSMLLFYNVFYHNPYGPWRYMLGFEPTWMPQEDLTIFRRIQFSPDRAESYDPWIEKMTEKDRMLLLRASKPNMPRLEWHEVVPTVWSGRLARRVQGTDAQIR